MRSSLKLVNEFKAQMIHKFEMTDLGLFHYFLGLEINQKAAGIMLTQKKYAGDLLQSCGMKNCKQIATPMNANKKL